MVLVDIPQLIDCAHLYRDDVHARARSVVSNRYLWPVDDEVEPLVDSVTHCLDQYIKGSGNTQERELR